MGGQAPLYLSLGDAMANSTDDCSRTTLYVSERYCATFSYPVMGFDGSDQSSALSEMVGVCQ